MKICDTHWELMKLAIEERGLMHLVAKSSEEAVTNVVTELQGGTPPYDPLMSANWMICERAIKEGGLYLMTEDAEGKEYCPLCEVEKHVAAGTANVWITSCFDSILNYCREQKLVTGVQ